MSTHGSSPSDSGSTASTSSASASASASSASAGGSPASGSPFAGLWPAVITPLTSDGRVAYDTLERMVDLFATQGLDGLYLTGSTGQWPLLSGEERRRILECAARAAAGRLPIMAHVGATTTAETVALAEHAAASGAAAVSAVAPSYYGYSPDVVFSYYTELGRATPLPLFAYHLSTVNTVRLPPAEFVARLLEVPNIAGMKITDVDLYLFGLVRAHGGDRLRLFSGADEVLCHAVLSGAIGAIGTFYNLWGVECQRARRRMAAGDVAAATAFTQRFQMAISRSMRTGSVWSFLRKAMHRKHGLDIGMPRPPLGSQDRPWSDADVDSILESMAQ
jgi:N-acetylneuraminate lyase